MFNTYIEVILERELKLSGRSPERVLKERSLKQGMENVIAFSRKTSLKYIYIYIYK